MADERRNNRRYRTYGSVAYQPEYERDNTVRQPARRLAEPARRPQEQPRPRIKPRERVAPRPSVELRPQSAVAPFAVAGFAAVLVCALVLVMLTAQLAVTNNDIVSLRGQLADLQEEERQLQTQYELVYDLEAIEEMFLSNGTMVRPGPGQTVYLDLTGEDSVVYYEGADEGMSALIHRAEDFLAGILPG